MMMEYFSEYIIIEKRSIYLESFLNQKKRERERFIIINSLNIEIYVLGGELYY